MMINSSIIVYYIRVCICIYITPACSMVYVQCRQVGIIRKCKVNICKEKLFNISLVANVITRARWLRISLVETMCGGRTHVCNVLFAIEIKSLPKKVLIFILMEKLPRWPNGLKVTARIKFICIVVCKYLLYSTSTHTHTHHHHTRTILEKKETIRRQCLLQAKARHIQTHIHSPTRPHFLIIT